MNNDMKILIATVLFFNAAPAFAQEYSSLPAPYPVAPTAEAAATTAQAYEVPVEQQAVVAEESPETSFYYSSDGEYAEESDSFSGITHMNF